MGNDLSQDEDEEELSRSTADRRVWFHYAPRTWELMLLALEDEDYDELSVVEEEPPRRQRTCIPTGYAEEIFLNLEDPDKYECSICFCILKDSRKCMRNHRFCYQCICKWVYEYSRRGSCPLCRADTDYSVDNETIDYLSKKAVKCLATTTNGSTCSWKGPLDEYEFHLHTSYTDEDNRTRLEKSVDYAALFPKVPEIEPLTPQASVAPVSPIATVKKATPRKTPTPSTQKSTAGRQTPRTARTPSNPTRLPSISRNISGNATVSAIATSRGAPSYARPRTAVNLPQTATRNTTRLPAISSGNRPAH